MTHRRLASGKKKRFVHCAATFCTAVIASVLAAGCMADIVEERVYETPAGFLLGPEDVLEITVWKNPDLSRITSIRPDGLISMPIIGDVQASGLTADALAHRIAERLKQFVAGNPAVSVSVKELNSYSVFVLGEVTRPGKYRAKSYLTLLQAISMAGGFTEYAKKNSMQVVRLRPNGDHKIHELRIPVRYDDLLIGNGEPGNIILLSGDTVVVP